MFFHVTGARHLEAIRTQGLRTDAEGWDAGYVWFFDDFDIATAAGQPHHLWGGTREHVIIEFDLTGLDVVPDPHPGWGDERDAHAFAVAHSVEAERIQSWHAVERLRAALSG